MADRTEVVIREEGEQKTAPAAERPAWLPEKFKSPEDLASAYAELEKKQSGAPAGVTMQETKPEEVSKKVADAGLDFAAIAAEAVQNGALSEETLKALEAKGITRAAAEVFVEGQRSRSEKLTAALASVAGGAEELTQMVKWGAANYSKEELAAYNTAVQSGDAALAKLAVEGLKARYLSTVGKDSQRVVGGAGGSPTGLAPFESARQMADAMRDPRYAKDAAYRREVEARVKASPRFFG